MQSSRHSSSVPDSTLFLCGIGTLLAISIVLLEHFGWIPRLATKLLLGTIYSVLFATAWRSVPQSLWKQIRYYVLATFIGVAAWAILGVAAEWYGFPQHTANMCILCLVVGIIYLALDVLVNQINVRDVINQQASEQIQFLESQMEALQADLEQSQVEVIRQARVATVGELASGAAHDLNNALTPLLVGLEALEAEVSVESQELVERMKSSASHAANVASQLLQYPGNRSATEYPAEPVDVLTCVQRAIALTRPRWHDEARKRGIIVEVQLAQRDRCVVRGSSTQMVQLVTNLILNAVDAMPDGGRVRLSVSAIEGDVEIRVQDEGAGMTKENREQCFDPFFTTREFGPGLGLSICRRIATRFGGTIEALPNETSRTGTGTRMIVILPALTDADQSSQKLRPRMLLIEDDIMVREFTAGLVISMGWQVDSVGEAELGIDLMNEREYDLVLLDYSLNDARGSDVLKALKARNANVVVASGWSVEEVRQGLEPDQMPDEVIQKPVTRDAIRRCLDRYTQNHGEE